MAYHGVQSNAFLTKLDQFVNDRLPESSMIGAYRQEVKQKYVMPKEDLNMIGNDKGIREINIRKVSNGSKQASEHTIDRPGTYEVISGQFVNEGTNMQQSGMKTLADGTQLAEFTSVQITATNKFGQSVSHEIPTGQLFQPSMPSSNMTVLTKGGHIRHGFAGMQHISKRATDHKIEPAVITTNNISKQNALTAPVNAGFSVGKDGTPLYKGTDYATP